ncbi:hypothetical protein ACP4OV_011751 [Aristida adscensionis]
MPCVAPELSCARLARHARSVRASPSMTAWRLRLTRAGDEVLRHSRRAPQCCSVVRLLQAAALCTALVHRWVCDNHTGSSAAARRQQRVLLLQHGRHGDGRRPVVAWRSCGYTRRVEVWMRCRSSGIYHLRYLPPFLLVLVR